MMFSMFANPINGWRVLKKSLTPVLLKVWYSEPCFCLQSAAFHNNDALIFVFFLPYSLRRVQWTFPAAMGWVPFPVPVGYWLSG